MLSKRCMETQTSQIVSENEHMALWHRAIKLDNAKHGKMNVNRQRHPKWEGRLPLQSSRIILHLHEWRTGEINPVVSPV